MKRLSVLFGLFLALAVSGQAFADAIPDVVGSTTNAQWKQTVFNDTGSAITSGMIVVWDNDDTEFDRSGYPYVTTTTTTDSPWIAGVVAAGLNCPDQSLCEIVVKGPAIVNAADTTDAFVEDTLVSTSAVAGQAGDWGNGDDTCFLGQAMELRSVDTGLNETTDNVRYWVMVDPGCN